MLANFPNFNYFIALIFSIFTIFHRKQERKKRRRRRGRWRRRWCWRRGGLEALIWPLLSGSFRLCGGGRLRKRGGSRLLLQLLLVPSLRIRRHQKTDFGRIFPSLRFLASQGRDPWSVV